MAKAERTDPKLWDKVKQDVTRGDKGGEPGQWSARKAQMAVQEYKRRGGEYSKKGPRQQETDLHEWTAEDWGTRSGRDSGDSGERYLPKKIRMLLTEDEYRRSTAKKRRESKGEGAQFSDQPRDVREKVSHIRHHGPTKSMLNERARELAIEGRSRMNKKRLLREIEKATDEQGRKKADGTGGGNDRADQLGGLSKGELYERARKARIEGRSKMDKSALVRALEAR